MRNVNSNLTARCRDVVVAGSAYLSLLFWSPITHADPQNDLLFFLSLESFENLSEPVPAIENSYVRPAADVLYAYNSGRFRFLGEYLWSSSESELERLKFGWRPTDRTMIWFGRFHSNAKFWTTEFHHGHFLQNSISRPGVEEWEDESGPMPSHITGLSLEHDVIQANQTVLNFGLAAGLGPVFEGQQLMAYDIFDPESNHKLSIDFRMAFRPDALSENQVGLLASWNDIPVIAESRPNLADMRTIDQFTIGLFADWHWDKWRLLSSWTYFENEITSVGSVEQDSFISGYLQGEYSASTNWTIFARIEDGFGEDNSPFLNLLPAFISHRYMLGLRWDFADNQSLTGEFADTSVQNDGPGHDKFKEVRFQWSAVFP